MTRAAIAVATTAFQVLYAAGAALLWVLAYQNTGAERGALVGAASATTAGIAAVATTWFTSWRTHHLQERREFRAVRRQTYGNTLAALAEYQSACRDVAVKADIARTSLDEPDRSVAARSLRKAQEHKDASHQSLLPRFGEVEIVGSAGVLAATRELREALSAVNNDDNPDLSTFTEKASAFTEAARKDVEPS